MLKIKNKKLISRIALASLLIITIVITDKAVLAEPAITPTPEPTATPEPTVTPEPIPTGNIIIAFGDSITVGYPYITYNPHGARVGGYEPKLEALYSSIRRSIPVLNYGARGEATFDSVNRIDQVLDANPDATHILIMDGANDINKGVSRNTTIRNLGIMIDKSLARGLTVVIATLTPHPELDVGYFFSPQIVALAQKKGALLADMFGAMAFQWNTLTDDGLHPNDAGYQVMAETWFNAIGITTAPPSGGGGSGCFIATAAYGSIHEPYVRLLRQFRDHCLLTNTIGEGLVDFYYKHSPPIAEVIADNNMMKTFVRWSLLPLVGWSWLALHIGLLTTLIFTFVSMLLMGAGIYRLFIKTKADLSVDANHKA